MFVPSTVAEYLGWRVNFAERVDLGGATPIGMVWRAAAAIELGLCDVVVCAAPSRPTPSLAAQHAPDVVAVRRVVATSPGSPQAEFDIPYGNLAQNGGYAMIANRYAAEYGYDPRATAKIAAEQRTNACANPEAVFHDQPDHDRRRAGLEDGRRPAAPARDRDAVRRRRRRRGHLRRHRPTRGAKHRPVHVAGFGEHLTHKTPTYAPDLLRTPIGPAADRAFAMAGVQRVPTSTPSQLYDCYTITVLLSIEDSGLLRQGRGHGLRPRQRPDLRRQLPAQHPRRSARVRPGRAGRRLLAGDRGACARCGARPTAARSAPATPCTARAPAGSCPSRPR